MKFTIYQESRPGKRANNEDRLAHCYSRDALLMVVADGMDGLYYGEIAAQIRADDRPAAELAQVYGISLPHVYHIKSGRCWPQAEPVGERCAAQ